MLPNSGPGPAAEASRYRTNHSKRRVRTSRTHARSTLAKPMMAHRHRVLHHGHAAYIVVESVEKPTDRRARSLLCLPHG
jgi:hypothetical protein